MVMYDSLNRNYLEPYGCGWTKTPNFKRLAEKSAMFLNSYVGSLPCMPARRELHTGRCNFLHRSWSPVEPFDDSMPEILKKNGVYTHLCSDHQHYWEDGGATYHTRYSSWEISRGQEGDPWKAKVDRSGLEDDSLWAGPQPHPIVAQIHGQDLVNRRHIDREEKMPQAVTFKNGLEFIEENHGADDWFLQIETFDPHEPFYAMQEYKDLYPHDWDGKRADWPPYYIADEDEKTVDHVRREYAALLSMCDRYLGKVLDAMDKHDLWKDTMLIVNTDHGYLLGEHGWWSKAVMPVYNEIANTPLFIYDPRSKVQGAARQSLAQTIDLPATLLDFFGLEIPKDMQGKSLRPVVESDTPVRDYALFGFHGSYANVCDGRYVYMRAPNNVRNQPLFEYTLMPTHMRQMFKPEELQDIGLAEPFDFTKGCRTMKIAASAARDNSVNFGTKLFDLSADPRQERSLDDPALEARLAALLQRALRENEAPAEQYERLGLPASGPVKEADIRAARERIKAEKAPAVLRERTWTESAANMFRALRKMPFPAKGPSIDAAFVAFMETYPADAPVTETRIMEFIRRDFPADARERISYFIRMEGRLG